MAAETYQITSKIADASFAFIALFDFIMDIIILVKWYNDDKMIFFGVGISFIILAQLVYCCMFHLTHTGNSNTDTTLSIICTIPFTSCLQIIWILVIDSESLLRKYWCIDINIYIIIYFSHMLTILYC